MNRRLLPLSVAGLVALIAAAIGPFAVTGLAAGASSSAQSLCIAHHPQEFVWYTHSCTGHDEPEIDPLSNRPGSAQDLTWTIVLPADGTINVDAVGPTFWIGGTVTDPNSLFGQAFLELQFYPNSIVSCASGGGYNAKYAANVYTV